MYIDKHAAFIFDRGSTFNYNPTIDDDSLIQMLDHSSVMYFNGSQMESFGTPLRLSTGMLCFDNDVTLSSKLERPAQGSWLSAMSCYLTPTSDLNFEEVSTSISGQANAVAWSPNGCYLAVGLISAPENLKIYSFDGTSLSLVTAVTTDEIRSLSWSFDGVYLAVGGITGGTDEVQVFSFDGSLLLSVAEYDIAPNETVNTVAWSPYGDYLAVGTTSGASELKILRFDGSRLVLVAQVQTNQVSAISWTHDGCYLAAAENVGGRQLSVYRFDGVSLVRVVDINPGNVARAIAWSPDNTYIAIGLQTTTNEVKVYRFNGVSVTLVAKADMVPNVPVRFVDWSPNGVHLAVGTGTGGGDEFKLYQFDGRCLLLIKEEAMSGTVPSVSWSPNGLYIAAAITGASDAAKVYCFGLDYDTCVTTSNMLLNKFDTASLDNVATDAPADNVTSVSWTPDGSYLAVGFESQNDLTAVQVYPFDGESLGTAILLPATVSGLVYSLDWSPDGKWLAVGFANGADNEIIVYEFDGTSLTTIGAWAGTNSDKTAYCVKWSPCGGYLAVSFDSVPGAEVVVYSFNHDGLTATGATASSASAEPANSVSWTPDGVYLAVGYDSDGKDDEVKVYQFDPMGGSLTVTSSGAASVSGVDANVVSWSPDGTYLAAGFAAEGLDAEVLVYRFDGYNLSVTGSGASLYDSTTGVKSLDWSPDGAYLAVGYENNAGDDNVQVYKFTGLNLIDTGIIADDTNAAANAVAWSPDGAYLAAGFSTGATNEVHVYAFGDNTYTWDTTGFIFGDSSYTDGSRDLDVRVLSGARVAIEGRVVDDSVV